MLKKLIIMTALLTVLIVLLSLWCVDKLAWLSGRGAVELEGGGPLETFRAARGLEVAQAGRAL